MGYAPSALPGLAKITWGLIQRARSQNWSIGDRKIEILK